MKEPVSTTAEYTVRDQERMRQAERYFEWQADLAAAALGRRVVEIGAAWATSRATCWSANW